MDAQQAAAVAKARASKATKDGRTAVTLPPTRREAMMKECQTAYAFDEEEEAFVGIWIDSTSSYLWRYRGWLDEAGTQPAKHAQAPPGAR